MRLFIAIDIDEKKIIEEVNIIQSKLSDRKKLSNNLHITLLFIGKVSNYKLSEIKMKLTSIKFKPFYLNFIGIDIFIKKYTKIIWAKIDKQSADKLLKIKQDIDQIMEVKESFIPHMTIYRIKDNKCDMKQVNEFRYHKLGKQYVSTIKLKQSQLYSNGPIYSDLLTIYAKC